MKNKNKAAKIFFLIIAVALSFTVLVSCDVDQIKGKYRLAAVEDTAGIETLEYYKSYTLTMNSNSDQKRYILESYSADEREHGRTAGDWTYEKKDLSFYRTKHDPNSDKEDWNKKEKTITLTRYRTGNRIVVYTFKKE
jgi:hypothetical protein